MIRKSRTKNKAEPGEPLSLFRIATKVGLPAYTRFRSLLRRLPKENSREMIRLMTLKDNIEGFKK
jgi:hypothetical protein